MKCTVTLAIILLANFAQVVYSHAVVPSPIEVQVVRVADSVSDPDPLCPYPSEDLTFFPYPDDCAKYYECYEGNKYLITCPTDMLWDAAGDLCVDKQSVNCGTRGSSTASPGTTTPTPTPGTGPTPFAPDPLCPYPSEDLTFFPNTDNCAQYWECYEGKKYLITCPSNMLWNDKTDECDAVQNVNCDSRSPTASPGSTTPTPTPGTGPTPFAPDPLCPYPSEDLTFFPNMDNCAQYWECYEGKKYLITCPTNMLWNDKTDECDAVQNVDCDRTITTGSPNTGPTQLPDNRCAGQPNGSFHSNPTDCSKFYECDEGKPVDEQCPTNTLWNEEILTCDYPYNVVCNV